MKFLAYNWQWILEVLLFLGKLVYLYFNEVFLRTLSLKWLATHQCVIVIINSCQRHVLFTG